MKILQVVTRSDSVGGAQVHVTDLSSGLLRAGHDVVVLCGGAGPYLGFLRSRGIPVIPLRYLRRNIEPVSDALAFHELVSVFRKLRPDLVALHSSKAGLIGRLAARSVGIPCVFTAHGWAFTEGISHKTGLLFRTAERLAAPLAGRIIAVSDYDRDLALRSGVSSPEQIVTVRNGVLDTVHRAAHGADRPPHLVMVARFEAPKDHATLLRAFAGLPVRARLSLVGDGPGRTGAEQLAAELGLSKRVEFLGVRNDVAEILASADLFVLASHWEGLPLSILEALRAGLPVVASAVGGVLETVADGWNGYLVPAGDDRRLGAKLEELAANAALRAEMGHRSRIRYETSFSHERMLSEVLSVYEQVLAQSRGSNAGARRSQ